MTNWGIDLIMPVSCTIMDYRDILMRLTPSQQNSHWDVVSSTFMNYTWDMYKVTHASSSQDVVKLLFEMFWLQTAFACACQTKTVQMDGWTKAQIQPTNDSLPSDKPLCCPSKTFPAVYNVHFIADSSNGPSCALLQQPNSASNLLE